MFLFFLISILQNKIAYRAAFEKMVSRKLCWEQVPLLLFACPNALAFISTKETIKTNAYKK